VSEVSWSRCDGRVCIRIDGVAPDADVRVFPRIAGAEIVGLPPMAGSLVRSRDRSGVAFVPRFPFIDGTTYTVIVDREVAAVLIRPRPDDGEEGRTEAEVVSVYPSASTVPRNLLRFYVSFSAPMREGCAAAQVRLVDDDGDVLIGAFLPTEYELWHAARQRLTVLLDPARIKRGLVGHREAGYPLQSGSSFRLVIGDGFLDAQGRARGSGFERRYQVGDDARGHVDPTRWTLAVPSSGTVDPLTVSFERPLDQGLVARCLVVVGPDGQAVDGTPTIGPEERSWRFVPRRVWASGPHQVVVDPLLEDVAGNSVTRVFDRDLDRAADEPRSKGPVRLTFRPG
jgi:hypothetical protein